MDVVRSRRKRYKPSSREFGLKAGYVSESPNEGASDSEENLATEHMSFCKISYTVMTSSNPKNTVAAESAR